MALHHGVVGDIAVITDNGLILEDGAPVHIAIVAADGVIVDPGVVSRLKGQVVFALHKAAQVPGPNSRSDGLQGADAVQEGVLLVGDIGDLVLLGYSLLSLLFLFYGGKAVLAKGKGSDVSHRLDTPASLALHTFHSRSARSHRSQGASWWVKWP